MNQVEQNPLHFMRRLLLDHGLGLLRFNNRYAKYALQIALTFQPPLQHEPLRRVGYDPSTGALTTPNSTIDFGGEITPTTCTLDAQHLPAASLQRPGDSLTLPPSVLQGGGDFGLLF